MRRFGSFILIPLFLFLQKEGHYERHNQSCGGMESADIKWSLEVKKNKTYLFQITEQKNKYLSKSEATFLAGTWETKDDTLKLSSWAKDGDVLFFREKDDKLIFLGIQSKIKSRSLAYLDYLEKSKEQIQ